MTDAALWEGADNSTVGKLRDLRWQIRRHLSIYRSDNFEVQELYRLLRHRDFRMLLAGMIIESDGDITVFIDNWRKERDKAKKLRREAG